MLFLVIKVKDVTFRGLLLGGVNVGSEKILIVGTGSRKSIIENGLKNSKKKYF